MKIRTLDSQERKKHEIQIAKSKDTRNSESKKARKSRGQILENSERLKAVKLGFQNSRNPDIMEARDPEIQRSLNS